MAKTEEQRKGQGWWELQSSHILDDRSAWEIGCGMITEISKLYFCIVKTCLFTTTIPHSILCLVHLLLA